MTDQRVVVSRVRQTLRTEGVTPEPLVVNRRPLLVLAGLNRGPTAAA